MAEYVYDRTQSDVDNETAKGYINYTDLNRIESAMRELEENLRSLSYTIGEFLVTKTDWKKQGTLGVNSIDNIPTYEHLVRIINNEAKLLAAYFVYTNTPSLPETLENATYQTFNDVEQILHDMHLMIEDMKTYFVECDTFYCGEEYS